MSWTGTRVLVTGAGGFIGSHLVERLVHEGADVVGFVRYTSRGGAGLLEDLAEPVRRHVELVWGDLRDAEAVQQAARGCRIIMHLGALIAIPYSYVHPREVVETNVLGTLNVLSAARAHSTVARVVHTSTSEVYGTALYAPIDEKHPLQGQSPYSASKIGADKLVESFTRSFDVPAVTIRPFNTYGPRQSTRAIIPTVIVQALTRPEIHLGDLRPTRDLTYVADTVDGFVRAAEAPPEVVGETINLGTGIEISMLDLVTMINTILGQDKPVVQDTDRLRPARSEVYRLIADHSKATATLAWQPQHTLQQGLELTIEWLRTHLDRYDPTRYQR